MKTNFVARKIQDEIVNFLFQNKVIILYGARQTGKTSMVRQIVASTGKSYIWLNADESDIADLLTNRNSAMLKSFFGDNEIVVIDEAQRIKDIGLTLKLIIDTFPDYQLIATGSSSFDLAGKVTEPLTGRKWEYLLHPFSAEELAKHNGLLAESRLLQHRLIFGMYPDVALHNERARKTIKTLTKSYLYKDVLAYNGIRHSDKIMRLVKALALQIGSEVSYNELAGIVELDAKTVEKYIDVLEQCFIIFRLYSFRRNLRTELKKAKKVYFIDNGVRNAVIGSFAPIENRTDKGQLWENFIVSERYKYLMNNDIDAELYFWRTQLQQEIDLIEVSSDKLMAYEIKWNPKAKNSVSKSFLKAYPDAEFKTINTENYITFIN